MSVDVKEQGGPDLFSSGPFDMPLLTANDPFFLYSVASTTPDINSPFFDVSGNVSASNDASTNALLSPALTYTNQTSGTLEFEVWLEWDVTATAVDWSTSLAWNTSGTGSFAQSLPGQSIWQLYLDGNLVETVGDDPTLLGGDGASNAFDVEFGSYGAVAETMSIKMAFSITEGDSVQFNGLFSVVEVPAPGALALLAVGGLAARPRRRR